jgi:hypothetical protein
MIIVIVFTINHQPFALNHCVIFDFLFLILRFFSHKNFAKKKKKTIKKKPILCVNSLSLAINQFAIDFMIPSRDTNC